jgi:uncharacterized protein
MERTTISDLAQWLDSPSRKPLVLRGARQVGKTWSVRRLAELSGRQLIELNIEKRPQLASLFESNDPQQIVFNIESAQNCSISAKNSLLFIDEIQAAPEILAKLRWFAEDYPELPVVTAGSLLEFTLAEHSFSMPVGRIQYMHIEPLSFEEFLQAIDQTKLYAWLHTFEWGKPVPTAIHQQLMQHFKEYIIVGGLPAAVASWIEERSLSDVNRIHYDLLSTYRDDFAKYAGRVSLSLLEDVLNAIPKMLGNKFVYSRINKDETSSATKKALHLLAKARLCSITYACAANGLPFAAERNDKHFKVVFLDVGLSSALLGLNLNQIQSLDEINLINRGGVAEQVVGQLLRTLAPNYIEPHLFYWVRERKGSEAEVDYLTQHQSQIIPIEVKAGSTGSLKSLHLLMAEKALKTAVRINADSPTQVMINTKTAKGKTAQYQLHSLPFYLLGQLHRLLPLGTPVMGFLRV